MKVVLPRVVNWFSVGMVVGYVLFIFAGYLSQSNIAQSCDEHGQVAAS